MYNVYVHHVYEYITVSLVSLVTHLKFSQFPIFEKIWNSIDTGHCPKYKKFDAAIIAVYEVLRSIHLSVWWTDTLVYIYICTGCFFKFFDTKTIENLEKHRNMYFFISKGKTF